MNTLGIILFVAPPVIAVSAVLAIAWRRDRGFALLLTAALVSMIAGGALLVLAP